MMDRHVYYLASLLDNQGRKKSVHVIKGWQREEKLLGKSLDAAAAVGGTVA